MQTTKKTETAAQRYASHRKNINATIESIKTELDRHAKRAAGEPENWGYAGDLARTSESLRDILTTMVQSRIGWRS